MSTRRLLSINNFHYRRAGSDAAFMDHDQLFRVRGWETAVFSMRHSENIASPWDRFFVREIELAREHSAIDRLRMATKVVYSREARRQIQRLLAVYTPEIVHVHSIYHHISPSVLPVLAGRGIPIVMTAHDYKLACPAYKMFDGRTICEECRGGRLAPLVRKRCLHGSRTISALVALETMFHRWRKYYERHIDRIICPSLFSLEKLAEWGWPRARLVHIPNFVDASVWTADVQAGRYFLYSGRFAPEKGLDTLIHACALSKLPTKIVGWGTLREQLSALAQQLGAPVEIIDRVLPHELSALVRGARAVVVPSQWYENASLSILEAFASGKPVIATRIGGNPELVQSGENGWLVEPGDVRALADLQIAIWNKPDHEIESFGCRARSIASSHFSAERYYQSITQLYHSLGVRS